MGRFNSDEKSYRDHNRVRFARTCHFAVRNTANFPHRQWRGICEQNFKRSNGKVEIKHAKTLQYYPQANPSELYNRSIK